MIPLNYHIREVLPSIYRLHFASGYQLAMHFLRVQEYYESPKYHKQIFELVDYMDWYASEHKGIFSYPKDWSGFNVPSSVLKEVHGRFGVIKDYNKYDCFMCNMYDHIKNQEARKNPDCQWDTDFYLIGTSDSGYRGDGDSDAVLNHEYAHAFWHNDITYKQAMSLALDKIDGGRYDTVFEIINEMGYHSSTCRDEVHAFCATGPCKELRSVLSGINTKPFEKLFKQKLQAATKEMGDNE